MSALPEQWRFLATGWRFALVLTGCRDGADRVFKETVDEILRHPDAGSGARLKLLFFNALRRKALRFPARCDLSGLGADLHNLLEPGRSALTLSLLEALNSDELEHILSLSEKQLVDCLEKARAQLPASSEMPVTLAAIEPDQATYTEMASAAANLSSRQGGLRISARNPATLAVALGFLLLVVVLTWHFFGEFGMFPDEAVKIATAGAAASPEQFDPVDNIKATQLKDWFMLKGFDTFELPPGLEDFHVVGVRLFKFEAEPVAQAAIQENTMFFYAFAAQPLGINVAPEKTWRITEADRWVLALREEKGICFMVAFRGKKSEMEAVLHHAK